MPARQVGGVVRAPLSPAGALADVGGRASTNTLGAMSDEDTITAERASESDMTALPVARHKTALSRTALSRPIARAVDDNLITNSTTVFDYGCGRGGDLRRLNELGIKCAGWDPKFRPSAARESAELVNIGYVVNVIDDARERDEALRSAWRLARHVLIVSARLENDCRQLQGNSCKDGVLTSTGTFQKLYTQESLRDWVESTLQAKSVAAAPGIFYVFREPVIEQAFLATRVRRAAPRVRVRVSEALFAEHQQLLAGLMEFVEARGRLPRGGEFEAAPAIIEALGGLSNAFQIVKRVTGEERWDRVRVGRSEDLLVYLGLSRFGRRPRLSHLPEDLQFDIKDLFGSYKAGCAQADRLLYSVADAERVSEAARATRVGKRTPSALYVHVTALSELAPVLRVLDGCAKALVGTIDEATLVKFHLDRPAVSYLDYPDFETQAHPALRSGYIVRLDQLRVDYRNYADHLNPPILHRKETFIATSHPLYNRFARLTRSEARAGLYREPSRIGTRQGWQSVLAREGVVIAGHTVRVDRARLAESH